MKINPFFNNTILKPVLDTFYPPVCFICNFTLPPDRKIICPSCWNKLPRFGPVKINKKKNNIINKIYILFKFEKQVRKLIHLYKYNRFFSLASYFSEDVLNSYTNLSDNNYSCIIPVPLHKLRLRERGYNQSLLLAKYIGRFLNVPVLDDALSRIRNTVSQTILDEKKRRDNVTNAFQCNYPLKDKKILLVDDIITTGNTVKECANTLQINEVKNIDILAIAGIDRTIIY